MSLKIRKKSKVRRKEIIVMSYVSVSLSQDAHFINTSGLSHFYKAEFRGKKILQKVIKYRNIDDKVLAAFEKEVRELSKYMRITKH